jgi:phosphoglucosamine mutase
MTHGDAWFGTDGVRDRAGEGRLSPENVRRLGRAVGSFARDRVGPGARVFAARDTRPSGPALLRGLAEGLAAEGLSLEDGGVMPTPAIAWWVASGGCDLGLAITASHNPPTDNGVKVLLHGGRKASREEEADIEARIRRLPPAAGSPRVVPRGEAADRYAAAAVAALEGQGRLDGLRLAVDCANGATERTARRVLEALGADVRTPVGSDPAGEINAGCGTEHPAAWRAAVRTEHAHGGLAFDGDGDRVLLADEEGEILDGDPVLHLLAREMHARAALPSDLVVSTVMANAGLEDALARFGVRLERTPVGDRFVAERMRETGAALGGEPSGHVLLRWGDALVGDGLVAGVRALQAARRRGLALSAARAEVPRWPQLLRNVRVQRKVPLEEAPAFLNAVRREEGALAGRGRVVVRYSGTEPLLRIMVEAPDEGAVREAVSRLETAAARIGAPRPAR